MNFNEPKNLAAAIENREQGDEMETKHTPTPWKLDEDNSLQVPFEGHYAQVAIVTRTTWTYPEQDKNVRFRELTKNVGKEILEAVNSHATLTAALGACVDALEAIKDATIAAMAQAQSRVPTGENVPKMIQEAMNKICAALQQAKKARG